MTISFSLLWFFRTAKAILFWLYLWQLKEYHIGRFLDHFKTSKGKQILFHPFFAAKILLFIFWFFAAQSATLLLLLLYLGEGALFFRAAVQNTLLQPVLTRKTFVLIVAAFTLETLFLGGVLVYFKSFLLPSLVLFDIFLPFIASAIVLGFQPFFVLFRSRIIAKAKAKRKAMKNLKVVGITGSYGKTSTKEILSHILSKKFVVLKTPEHRNSEIGISKTLLYDLTDEHEVFVCEMGAYNKGGIRLLASIAQPTLGIITGVNEQHLALFGKEANLLSGEGGGELAEALSKDSALIVNYDSKKLRDFIPWLQLWNPDLTRYIWCSAKTSKDVWAKDVVVEKERIQFTLVAKEGEEKLAVPVIGGHHLENILLAAAGAGELGMSLKEIGEALKELPGEVGSMRILQGAGGISVVDSTYSANPDGVIAALEYLKLWEGKKILVMPCLIELGKTARGVHEKIGEKIEKVCDYAIITTKDHFEDIKKGAKGMKGEDLVFLENPKEIRGQIRKWAKRGDVVLLEGRVPKGVLELLEGK